MIAIPNMEKPTSCYMCDFKDSCKVKFKTVWMGWQMVADDCPLIEIDDEVWENESHRLIRMTEERRVNKELTERRDDE